MAQPTPGEILEHWLHEPDEPALRAFAVEACRWTTAEMDMDDVEADWTRPAPGAASLDMLVCRSIGPHCDNWHPEWSALWVLRAGPGHTFHIADRQHRRNTRPRKPAKAITKTAALTVGSVVLFNAHRVHWLPPAQDRSALVVANFDFDARPTRQQITDMIVAAARSHAGSVERAA